MLQRLIIFFSWALISVVIWRPDFGFAQASRPHSTTAPKAHPTPPTPPTPVVPANIPGLNSSAQALGPVESLFKVDEIRIQGNKKVESEAILEKIRAQKGSLLDNYMLRKDIQIIYGMKYFDYVEAQQVVEGGKNILIYVVKERPIVQKIEFEGNSDLDDDELKEKIKTKEYNIQNVNEVKADVLTLQKYYEEKGYFLATIDYKFQQTSPENVTLTFDIK